MNVAKWLLRVGGVSIVPISIGSSADGPEDLPGGGGDEVACVHDGFFIVWSYPLGENLMEWNYSVLELANSFH